MRRDECDRRLDVGGTRGSWTVTTLVQDISPDPLTFTDRTNVAVSTTVQSNVLQVTGIIGNVSISIAGAGTYRVCPDSACASNPAFSTAPQTMANGAYVQLQATSSAVIALP